MLLANLFGPFIRERPICVMARATLERLLDPNQVDALFLDAAERQYQRTLLFSQLAGLMCEVTLGVQPSIHAAFQSHRETLGVSATALYNKLDRVETAVSEALVRESYRQAEEVIGVLGQAPESLLPGYRLLILDGNHLAATEHRIDELRYTSAAPLPGQSLAVLDHRKRLVRELFLCEDGHAQERSLLDPVLQTVQVADLWIADRNFCTLGLMCGIAQRGGCFLVRQHGQLHGQLLGRRKRKGKTKTGVVYEQRMQIHDPLTGKPRVLRRITIELFEKTRDGETEIHLLSNVPVRDATARKLADLYQERWTIERAFLDLTTTLTCEVKTLGYPKAALFAFSLAVLAYNAVAVIQAALRQEHGEKVDEEVSPYYLALEIEQAYDGMMVAIPDKHWKVFRTMSLAEFARVLCQISRHVKLTKYQKHSRGPKKAAPKRSAYRNGGHVSTARLLTTRKAC